MIKVTLTRRVKIPNFGSAGSAGLDFYIPNNLDVLVEPRATVKIPLGVKVILEPDEVLIMNDKSGVATNLGLHVIAGVVDSDYRGEIHACFFNMTDKHIILKGGDKIIQGIVVKYKNNLELITNEEYENIESLEKDNTRGALGFGMGTNSTY